WGWGPAFLSFIGRRRWRRWPSAEPRQAVNLLFAFAVPYVWLANEQQRKLGLHVLVSDIQRIPPGSVDPTAKNYHWNDMTMALLGALDAGADSVLLVDQAGNVVEGPGFNVFCVSQGVLVTPSSGMLEGISRRTVIEMAQTLELPVQLRALPAQELRQSQEVFLSTSGGGVLPVTRVDDQVIGTGEPGPVTRRMVETYWAWHRDPRFISAIDYG
ncbi:MAG: aminotransferase class IV, partial [Rhodoferax sp.]|nr:aminotransferase class IV [Rhodoferax sp.]